MPYSAEISRRNPVCMMFLLDQSGSMSAPFAGEEITKAEGAADAINKIIRALIERSSKAEGVRDYFDVAVIGYGSRENWAGPLIGQKFVKTSSLAKEAELVERMEKASDGSEIKKRVPIWFKPVANNGTPMCKALDLAYNWLKEWISEHPNAHHPIVFNITDGESTDGDPVPYAKKIMELSTSDGHVLVSNCHISETKASPLLFPAKEGEFPPDEFAKVLFNMSSELPEPMLKVAISEFKLGEKGSRAFAFNADSKALIYFLDIGTRPVLERVER